MASARYTLNIKPEDLKPDEPRQLTRKEKAANWWYYHRLHVGIAAAVLAVVVWLAADFFGRTLPDTTRSRWSPNSSSPTPCSPSWGTPFPPTAWT